MGISHDYYSYHGRRGAGYREAGRRGGGVSRFIAAAAAVLIISAGITAALAGSASEGDGAASAPGVSGNVQSILAPLPMQGESESSGEGAPAEIQLERFGPSRQYEGSYTLLAYDSTVISHPADGQVDLSYFADAAFLGDSLTVGFVDYKVNLGGALVCGYTGAGPDTIVNRSSVYSNLRGDEIALDVLAAAQPQKLYILLGTNTLTRAGAEEKFLAYYSQMLDTLRQTLGEDCLIYVQSIPPVRPAAAAEKPGLASASLRAVNEQLAKLAAEKGCVYLNLWDALADGEGNLKEILAAPDGVHLSAGNGYGAWVTYLRNHAKYSAENEWTPGSAYSL